MPWRVEFALPNIRLEEPIEARYIAVVPHDDSRVSNLRSEHANLDRFLSAFTDTHGASLEPSILLSFSPSSDTARTGDALAGFRDVLAAASILKGRVLRMRHSRRTDWPIYSNIFDPYPWVLDNEFEYITASSPAILALHTVEEFRPQCAPDLPVVRIQPFDLDQPLLRRLLDEWNRHFDTADPSSESIKLFRSLNVASQAMRMPGSRGVTIHDIGRSFILWASAFEILVHPGTSVMRSHVCDLLERVRWVTRFCRQDIYPKTWDRNATHNIACRVYELIYEARNRFTHGNPVSAGDLRAPGAEHYLWMHAAPLYRLALTAYLDMSYQVPSTAEEFTATYMWEHEQGTIEQALHTADPVNAARFVPVLPDSARPGRATEE